MRSEASSTSLTALTVLLTAALALAGCGQKGPLTLPDRQAPTSATQPTAMPAPAAPAAPAPPAPLDNESPKPADDRDNTKR